SEKPQRNLRQTSARAQDFRHRPTHTYRIVWQSRQDPLSAAGGRAEDDAPTGRAVRSSAPEETQRKEQYLSHLSGVDSGVDPPQFSYLGYHLLNTNGIGHGRKQF